MPYFEPIGQVKIKTMSYYPTTHVIIQHTKLLCLCGRIPNGSSGVQSGVQISHDIYTHLGHYLYSTKCSWIIIKITIIGIKAGI